MDPTEHEPITRRLHALGQQPVDPEVASRHRSLMASVPVASSRSRIRPLMAGSLLVGSLFGGMGLAAAAPGVPDAASDVAKTVLATVTLGAVDHPEDKAEEKAAKAGEADEADEDARQSAEKAAEKAEKAEERAEKKAEQAGANRQDGGAGGVARSTAGCPAGFTGNHGQYVSSVEDDPATTDVNERQVAAQSDCGKPVHAGGPADRPNEDDATTDKPASPGRSGEQHGQRSGTPAPDTERGRSGDDNPGDRPNQRAVDSVAEHRPAHAGKSAGRGPKG